VHDRSAHLLEWVILTMGDRPATLAAAVQSVRSQSVLHDDPADPDVTVVSNGGGVSLLPEGVSATVVESAENIGVPAGRDLGIRSTSAPLIGFLDDDAVLRSGAGAIVEAFDSSPELGVVSLRLVDEVGRSATRHVPRPGGRRADESGPVAVFLGGASVVRRAAYEQVGGYFTDLQYGHEEVELSWRLIDAGWQIRYLADVEVFHPRAEIGRHEHGWRLTGRNRVWVARRTLPWPVAIVHVTIWLVVGVWRAPDTSCRCSYLSGWWQGWRTTWPSGSPRRPISWRGVWRLTRLGRPPIV